MFHPFSIAMLAHRDPQGNFEKLTIWSSGHTGKVPQQLMVVKEKNKNILKQDKIDIQYIYIYTLLVNPC